jgi:hypothetical protein
VTRTLRVEVMDPCGRCSGSGRRKARRRSRCSTCGGSGRGAARAAVVPRPARERDAVSRLRRRRPAHRDSRATVQRPRAWSAAARSRSPCRRASRPGDYLTLRGQGNAGARGGPRGDVLVVLEVEEDERFIRHGCRPHLRTAGHVQPGGPRRGTGGTDDRRDRAPEGGARHTVRASAADAWPRTAPVAEHEPRGPDHPCRGVDANDTDAGTGVALPSAREGRSSG